MAHRHKARHAPRRRKAAARVVHRATRKKLRRGAKVKHFAARLKRYAAKAVRTVGAAKGDRKCGTSPRGAKIRVCLSTRPIPGASCGLNPVNKLYACALP